MKKKKKYELKGVIHFIKANVDINRKIIFAFSKNQAMRFLAVDLLKQKLFYLPKSLNRMYYFIK